VLPCIVGSDGNRDGLPVSIVEALATGLPVITTPMTGNPEVIEENRNGLLVPFNDAKALAEAMGKLMKDSDFYHRLRKNTRASVESRFDDCNEWSGIPIVSIPEPDVSSYLSLDRHPRVARALKHVCNNIAVEQAMKDLIKEFSPELIYERYSNALLAEEGKRYRKQALQEASEFLEQTAFQATSLIVTVSNALKDSLIDSGIPATKIIEVSNGVDEIRCVIVFRITS
jgi:hypothetical protein